MTKKTVLGKQTTTREKKKWIVQWVIGVRLYIHEKKEGTKQKWQETRSEGKKSWKTRKIGRQEKLGWWKDEGQCDRHIDHHHVMARNRWWNWYCERLLDNDQRKTKGRKEENEEKGQEEGEKEKIKSSLSSTPIREEKLFSPFLVCFFTLPPLLVHLVDVQRRREPEDGWKMDVSESSLNHFFSLVLSLSLPTYY